MKINIHSDNSVIFCENYQKKKKKKKKKLKYAVEYYH